MTRINCVPVEVLSDKHILAEYKEITRPFNKVLARIEKGTMNDVDIPEHYRLGTGHETFFFDKLEYLFIRYQDLCEALLSRGVNIDLEKFDDICTNLQSDLAHTEYWNYWQPRPEDMYLNMARLVKRGGFESAIKESLS